MPGSGRPTNRRSKAATDGAGATFCCDRWHEVKSRLTFAALPPALPRCTICRAFSVANSRRRDARSAGVPRPAKCRRCASDQRNVGAGARARHFAGAYQRHRRQRRSWARPRDLLHGSGDFSRRAIPRARGKSRHARGRATADRRVDGRRRDLQGNRGGAPAGIVGRIVTQPVRAVRAHLRARGVVKIL